LSIPEGTSQKRRRCGVQDRRKRRDRVRAPEEAEENLSEMDRPYKQYAPENLKTQGHPIERRKGKTNEYAKKKEKLAIKEGPLKRATKDSEEYQKSEVKRASGAKMRQNSIVQ